MSFDAKVFFNVSLQNLQFFILTVFRNFRVAVATYNEYATQMKYT